MFQDFWKEKVKNIREIKNFISKSNSLIWRDWILLLVAGLEFPRILGDALIPNPVPSQLN